MGIISTKIAKSSVHTRSRSDLTRHRVISVQPYIFAKPPPFHCTRMPKPAIASIPAFAFGLPLPPLLAGGGGLVGRDDEAPNRDPGREFCPVGGGGNGAEGGGAGGPSPTTGIPRSSSGSEDRVFTPRGCKLSRDAERAAACGSGDCARDVAGRGMGLSSSSLGGGRPKSRSLSASIDESPLRLGTLLAEREGLRPRMGGVGAVKLRTGGGPVELRTEERKGAWSERTCMLVGRRRVRAFAAAGGV